MQAKAAATLDGKPVELEVALPPMIGVGVTGGVGSIGSGMLLFT